MNERTIRFKYVYPEDYRPVYSNSVYGGFSPRGEFEIHFLYDRAPLPDSGEIFAQDDRQAREQARYGPFNALHVVQAGVIMDYDSARRLHAWLGEKIQTYETAAGATKGAARKGPLQ